VTARVSHLALDGSRFEIQADLDLGKSFTSVVDVDVDGHRYEFTAGGVGLGDEVVAALGLPGFGEELAFAGGTLRIARGAVTDPRTGQADAATVAAWSGARHSLVTSLYNVSTAEVLGVFSTLRISEGPDGIAIAPAPDAAGTMLGRALVLKEVPGLGLLEISGRTRDAVRELPAWAGLALSSGELFRDTLSNGSAYLVLATPAAVVTVLPLQGTAADAVPEMLDSLAVSVRPAPPW